MPTAETPLASVLVEVWTQLLREERAELSISGSSIPVERTRGRGLRFAVFSYGTHRIEAIEQNPATTSRWAKLAREGQRIVQFSHRRRYFANVCEGRLFRYPSWSSLGLPD